jgi:hypothetical protein
MGQSEQVSISLPLVWVGAEELPVNFVNQFVAVVQPDEIFLTIGSLVPPAILGDTEEQREAVLRGITYVPVKPVARLGFTPARLREFIKVLQDTLSNYEQLPKQEV